MIIRVRHSRLSQWIIASVALPLASLPVSASPEGMQIQLCSADGAAKTLTIPLDRHDGNDSCAKPCHACLNRKKNIKSR
tara:strand:+ start:1416 stop:1652 length:237 start_codon:yes stop_codon:yes gene_type:complete